MSLGSRITTKARVTVRVSINSTPREPLLFLYPQWYRNSSTASAKPDPEQASTPKPSTPRPRTFRKIATTGLAPLNEQTKQFNGQAGPWKEATAEAGNVQDEASHTSSDSNAATLADGIESEPRPRRLIRPVSSTLIQAPIARKIFVVPPAPAFQAVRKIKSLFLKKKRKDYTDGPRRHREIVHGQNEEGVLYAEHLQELEEGLEEPVVVDWREILADLQQYTPDHGPWLERALRIVIPEESTETVVNAIDGHIWEIASNHNCSIKIASLRRGEEEEAGVKRAAFIASGSLISLGKLIAELTLAAPNMRTSAAGQKAKSHFLDFGPRTRWMDERSRFTVSSSIMASRGVPVNDLNQPDEWTSDTFLDYVRKILRTTNHVKRAHFKEHPSSASWQLQELAYIFQNPASAASVTRTAFHETLRYHIQLNQIRELRNLFVIMSRENMEMTTETFNIMLQGAAKARNLKAFRFVLHLMLNRSCLPNYETWFAFMEGSKDIEIRRHIAEAMKAKGLLGHKTAVKKLVFGLVSEEIRLSLESHEHPDLFIASMDARFTPDWLSVASSARILDAFASRGLISRCWEFLYFMQSRNIPPNTVCINIVLHHCKLQDNLEGIIEFLRSLPPTSKFLPDKATFHGLFFLAWHGHNYNLVRVIWRYACLYGATTFHMRWVVQNSLRMAATHRSHRVKKNLSKQYQQEEARFRQYVGPVVFGRNYREDHPMHMFESKGRDSADRDPLTIRRVESPAPQLEQTDEDLSHEYMIPDTGTQLDNSDLEFERLDKEDTEPTIEEQSEILDDRMEQEEGLTDSGNGQLVESTEPEPLDCHKEQEESLAGSGIEEMAVSPELSPKTQKTSGKRLSRSAKRRAKDNARLPKVPPIEEEVSEFGMHLNPNGPVFLLGDGALQETPQPQGYKERLVPHKMSILEDLTLLDLKVHQKWRPVRPMALLLVEAAELDKVWHDLIAEAEKAGKSETRVQQVKRMYDLKETMIDNAIGIEIESRDRRVSRMWN